MKIKDIKVGQPYFYQVGTASYRQKVNGDGAAYVLSTETFVATTSHDRGHDGKMPFYVRKAEYTGRPSRAGRTTGMLALVVRTLVHEGDVPQAARELVASMTLAQVSMLGFQIPSHIVKELREHSCVVDIKLLRPQTLLGEWDEVYTARKRAARLEREHASQRRQTQRDNADRWQDAMAQVSELLGEDVYFSTVASPTGEHRGEHRAIGIDVLERLIRLAEHGDALEDLIDTTGTG